ncbi:hypothetical protein [Cytobacillus oceanisediminis]|uniref:Uncharacterized protein n=1 Tax=Cytobacillus oceanisediminis 2691 TaxID=1196031 RepID=A0A161IXY2_9BACI|nr:hypothetical protein [Cytobacillus oceanisediminis]AND39605.1 hypothetical protein A361_10810 [Cytobacillus oceanisediminis 2691]
MTRFDIEKPTKPVTDFTRRPAKVVKDTQRNKYIIELDYLPEVLLVSDLQGSGDDMTLYTEVLFQGERPRYYEIDANYSFENKKVDDVDIKLKAAPKKN